MESLPAAARGGDVNLDSVDQLLGEMNIELVPWRIWYTRNHMSDTTRWHGRIELILHASTAGDLEEQITRLQGRTVESLAEELQPPGA